MRTEARTGGGGAKRKRKKRSPCDAGGGVCAGTVPRAVAGAPHVHTSSHLSCVRFRRACSCLNARRVYRYKTSPLAQPLSMNTIDETVDV